LLVVIKKNRTNDARTHEYQIKRVSNVAIW